MTRARALAIAAGGLGAGLALVVIVGRPRGALGVSALAAATALALVLRWAGTPRPERRQGARLVLVLLLLASVVQFHVGGGRIAGDGVSYYVYVRSLMKDGDLDFTDEYTHYELIDRADLKVPTRTGLRRSIFAVGPGLVWIPFFAAGEGVARAERAAGRDVDLSGYGPEHVNAVALGSLLYGFAAVLLIHELLRRHFPEDTALLGAVLIWWATFLYWYMVHQPTMSHAPSTAGAALVVWLWDRQRERMSWRGAVGLGLAAGLAMCLRWQNALLLLLPAWDVLREMRAVGWRKATPALGRGALIVAAALAGAVPQMAAWKLIYGEWLLRYPPHGADFLRLDHPFVLQTLFSSRHGLLFWTPVCGAGYLGFLWLWRRRPALAWPLLPPLVAMTYVNMCSGDWWAGGSFSNRRFDSLLPLLALGLAGALEWTRRILSCYPQVAVCAALIPAVTWNLGVLAQVRRGAVDADRAAFHSLAGGAASAWADVAGSPPTWPASWVFAWRERRPASQYDRAVGQYLFYRQNNLGGRIDLGAADDSLLGEGWGPRQEIDGRACRVPASDARVLAPLDVPEDLELTLSAVSPSGSRPVRIAVNGQDAGELPVSPSWAPSVLRIPAARWRREINDVVLRGGAAAAPAEGPVCVASFAFVRVGAPDAPRGFQAR
jgi:Dolichyl-phosphate-mannose-protein mannosyltransferase